MHKNTHRNKLLFGILFFTLLVLAPQNGMASDPGFSFPKFKIKRVKKLLKIESCQELQLIRKLSIKAPLKTNAFKDSLQCDSQNKGAKISFSLVDISNSRLSKPVLRDLKKSRESYIIIIGKRKGQEIIDVKSRTVDGLIVGMTSLQQMFNKNNLWYGTYRDWPTFPIRIFQFKISPLTHIPSLKHLVRIAVAQKMNTFLIKMSNDIDFKTLDGHLKGSNKLSIESLKEIVNYAQGLGLHVIPEFNMITKGNQFIVGDSQLVEQPDGSFLPSQEIQPFLKNWLSFPPQEVNGQLKPAKTYTTVKLGNPVFRQQFVEPLLEEILSVFSDAKIFSLGGDEALGYVGASHIVGSGESVAEVYRRKMAKKGQKVLSKNEYLNFVNYIDSYLTERHPRINRLLLAGDMFNHPDDFPHLKSINGIDDQSGDASGEFGDIMADLPPKTVIIPWHYFQKSGYENNRTFDTIDSILSSNLSTGTAVWYDKTTGKRFINYAKKKRNKSSRVKVVMATNWLTYLNSSKPKEHTAYQNFQKAKSTIQYSGRASWH